jgi:hypothetical protein
LFTKGETPRNSTGNLGIAGGRQSKGGDETGEPAAAVKEIYYSTCIYKEGSFDNSNCMVIYFRRRILGLLYFLGD